MHGGLLHIFISGSFRVSTTLIFYVACLFTLLLYVHNEELSDLYISPNIVQVIKSRRMGLGGGSCSAYVGEKRLVQGFGGGGGPKGKNHLGDPAVEGRIVLR